MGASGYGGGELLRLLSTHPAVKVKAATSKTYSGQPVCAAFGGLVGTDLKFAETNDLIEVAGCRVVFLAGGDSTSMCLAGPLMEAGAKVIDLGASFRFRSAMDYSRWYGEPHKSPELNAQAVYGLPELHRQEIQQARLVANPGCYTTAAILALAPAVKSGLVEVESIVINGISGASGAGRSKFGLDYHFAEMNENAWAYKLAGSHRHTGEMEQELSFLAGQPVQLSFTPHVVPMTRGVLVTCIAKLKGQSSLDEAKHLYRDYFSGSSFVHLLDQPPATKHTAGSNRCHIGLALDQRTGMFTVVAVLDNLGKGMAGQAVQNMNLLLGTEESAGLEGAPLWP